MPLKTPDSTQLAAYVMALVITLLGGAARVCFAFISGNKISLMFVVASMTLSLFAASMMLLVAIGFGWESTGIGIGCGVAAWSGATFINEIEKRFTSKLGGNNE